MTRAGDLVSARPLVSICIPTYQGRQWIRDTITSALAQDYPRIEVVVSDDMSTDGTPEVAEAIDDPRVRVFQSDSRLGMARNWNRSVRLSNGEYVKFLMQDDWLDRRCVSRMVEVLSRHPSAGFVFALRSVDASDPTDVAALRLARRLQDLPARLGRLGELNDGRTVFEAINRTGFRGNWIGEPTAVMVRRAALQRVGLFNTHMHQLTDLELWLRLAFFFDVGFVPETLAAFRLHSSSATTANAREGTAWLDSAWLLEGLRTHPEARESLGAWAEARVWVGVLRAEARRRVRSGLRGGHSYTTQLRDYLHYRAHPTRDLHERLDDA